MKRFAVSLFLSCFLVLNVHAAKAPLDTAVSAISANVLDLGMGPWFTDVSDGTATLPIDMFVPDSVTGKTIIKCSVDKRATYDTLIDTGTAPDTATVTVSEYPWTTLTLDLDSNFVGVTAIRLTYKADKPWVVSLNEPANDQSVYGNFQKTILAAPAWTTIYLNIKDTSKTGFMRPDWGEATRGPLIDYSLITGVYFDPSTPNDEAATQTIEIADMRLYHYKEVITTPVKFSIAKAKTSYSNAILLAPSNVLKFSVPENNTYSVSIVSPEGKLVASIAKSCAKGAQNEIALRNYNLVPGLYMVKVSQAGYSAMGKIIVK